MRGTLKWLVSADKHITSTEKLVFLVLLLYQNKEGECCPSINEISTASSLNKTTVTRALANLEEKGVIIKSYRYSKDGHKSNSYEIAPQHRAHTHKATTSYAQSGSRSRTKQRSKKAEEAQEGIHISVYNEAIRKMLEEK